MIRNRTHGFGDGRLIVESVTYTKTKEPPSSVKWFIRSPDRNERTLKHVDVIQLKTLEALFHGVEDVLYGMVHQI